VNAVKKHVPRNKSRMLPYEKHEKVIDLCREFPEIATHYMLGIKAGISPSSAGRIKQKYFPSKPEKRDEKKEIQVCDWLKLHVCWSLDSIECMTCVGKLHMQVLFEEYSRITLGWIASLSNTAERAVRLVNEAVETLGVRPLVVKFDRGSEFKNDELATLLKKYEILGMASPKNYPCFNGKLERHNLDVEKFLPKKGGAALVKIYNCMDRAMYCLNHEFPRRIFNGKTSAQVYAEGEMYRENEREALKNMVIQHFEKIELTKNPRWDKLDVERKAIVKSVVDVGLCSLKTRLVNAKQLQVVGV